MRRTLFVLAVWASACCGSLLAAQDPQVLPLAQEQIVPKLKTVTLNFNLPEAPAAGQQVRLALKVRVEYPSCANNPALVMAVNGNAIVGGDLLNKPLDYSDKNGRDVFWALPKGSMWYLYSWPDFSLERAWACQSPYAIATGVDPFEFVLDITSDVTAGANTVSFTHNEIVADLDHFLELRDVCVEIGKPIPSQAVSAAVQPPPTGPLTTYLPKGAQQVEMTVRLGSGGMIRLELAGHSFDLRSRTSEPDGRWADTTSGEWQPLGRGQTATARWTCAGYEVARTVTLASDHVHIADTFTNGGDQLIGIMYENRLSFTEKPLEVKLAGGSSYGDYQQDSGGANPTALARWQDLAVGLVAEDDVYRSHAKEFARADSVGLADHELGVEPGKSQTVEWSVYPVPGGDYWDFINAVRRNWGANFTIPGPDVFVDWSTRTHDEEYIRKWIAARGVTMLNSYDAMFDEGFAAMGTAIPLAKKFCAQTAAWIKEVHAVAPGVKAVMYMNATLCTEPGAAEKYADSRYLGPDGKQITMAAGSPQGLVAAPQFVCTLDDSYGKAMMATVKYIVNDLQADGLYHDVFNLGGGFAAHCYGGAWDGCTVTINPSTHQVTGKASSVVLLTQSWETAMVKYLRDHGKTIIANGPVETRTLLNLKIPVFVETGSSFDELTKTHLGSPWGYANHPVPDPAGDVYYSNAYQQRRMLDYGGILTLSGWGGEPKGLTFLQLMYPITPVELRSGMVFGEERILTNRSGRYGWADNSPADVYVVDADGKLVAEPLVKEVRESGRRLYEVRMSSDQFAILVKKR